MDLEALQKRAQVIQTVRNFFIEKQFLELDTPALAEKLIPETCLEVFQTLYISPYGEGDVGYYKEHNKRLFLVPSPEVYIKPIIAQHKIDVFQLSKCYRNFESVGRTHKSEFTMLEYYKMGADYIDSMALTENLFMELDKIFHLDIALRPPFTRLTVNDAFKKYAGFYLVEGKKEITQKELAQKARNLNIIEPNEHPFDTWQWEDLYQLIFVHAVEPALPCDRTIFLMDYPLQVKCLAKDKDFHFKERWELYSCGLEIANCYSEETDALKVKEYFEKEGKKKEATAVMPHPIDMNYWKIFSRRDGNTGFPKCSGVAMGIDRLLMAICGKHDITLV